jgi:hypothetical protein
MRFGDFWCFIRLRVGIVGRSFMRFGDFWLRLGDLLALGWEILRKV